eukprot:1157925-Pelagomonas_calceolata.AAC.1
MGEAGQRCGPYPRGQHGAWACVWAWVWGVGLGGLSWATAHLHTDSLPWILDTVRHSLGLDSIMICALKLRNAVQVHDLTGKSLDVLLQAAAVPSSKFWRRSDALHALQVHPAWEQSVPHDLYCGHTPTPTHTHTHLLFVRL